MSNPFTYLILFWPFWPSTRGTCTKNDVKQGKNHLWEVAVNSHDYVPTYHVSYRTNHSRWMSSWSCIVLQQDLTVIIQSILFLHYPDRVKSIILEEMMVWWYYNNEVTQMNQPWFHKYIHERHIMYFAPLPTFILFCSHMSSPLV